jgi:hypothetical protein
MARENVSFGSKAAEMIASIRQAMSALPRKRTNSSRLGYVRFVPIVLQKSQVEGRRIFRENPKQEAIADSYSLTRITEVAGEFNVRR